MKVTSLRYLDAKFHHPSPKIKKKSQKYQRTVGYPSTSWASCLHCANSAILESAECMRVNSGRPTFPRSGGAAIVLRHFGVVNLLVFTVSDISYNSRLSVCE